MKKFLLILKYIATTFTGLIATVFAFVEIRPLFAGDFLLMESPALGFVKYFFRGLFFLAMLVNAIKIFYCLFKNKGVNLEGAIFNGAIVAGSVMTFMFYEWYIALLLSVLNLLMFAIRLFIGEKEKEVAKDEQVVA